MIYELHLPDKVEADIASFKKSEPQSYRKVMRFLDELQDHPRTGTGKPERLKHYKNETWSRHISRKHRLVYEIFEEIVTVKVISTYGHYDNK